MIHAAYARMKLYDHKTDIDREQKRSYKNGKDQNT